MRGFSCACPTAPAHSAAAAINDIRVRFTRHLVHDTEAAETTEQSAGETQRHRASFSLCLGVSVAGFLCVLSRSLRVGCALELKVSGPGTGCQCAMVADASA